MMVLLLKRIQCQKILYPSTKNITSKNIYVYEQKCVINMNCKTTHLIKFNWYLTENRSGKFKLPYHSPV